MNQTFEEIKKMCYAVLDLINTFEQFASMPSCNTCMVKKNCAYAPKLGEKTRINCFAYVGKDDKKDEEKKNG